MRIQFLSTELFSVDLEARVRRVTGDQRVNVITDFKSLCSKD